MRYQLTNWMVVDEISIYAKPLIKHKAAFQIVQRGKEFAIFTEGKYIKGGV